LLLLRLAHQATDAFSNVMLSFEWCFPPLAPSVPFSTFPAPPAPSSLAPPFPSLAPPFLSLNRYACPPTPLPPFPQVSFATFAAFEELLRVNRRRLHAAAVPRLGQTLAALRPVPAALTAAERDLEAESDARARVGPETERVRDERGEAERAGAGTVAGLLEEAEAARAAKVRGMWGREGKGRRQG
jgi:hypothetical protein